ncbi:DUF7486 family protein [Flagellimonas nanhaiensis]|uniref:DUF7486 domain-containing protein n=1 Tax=Flagellimonas nanhaiensis TaxID=2292706 RepID=A0A371JUQ7_9FLAO|nr:hypothetical protein [Allomuricauda nanhaiensis]RDY61517.1 hypothetical protein DX873_04995 [Allomuricauda nanhaiensis]
MNVNKQTLVTRGLAYLILFCLGVPSINAQIEKKEEEQFPIYWHVKAFRPQAKFIDIKAIDKNGTKHDVKAIQTYDDTSFLNVKALVNGERLPIKLIVKQGDRFYPVKAIDNDGTIIDIKAITKDGEIWDVKGVSKSGNLVHLRAISKEGVFYNIIAVSPKGKVNDVKGIKMMDTEVETVINGVSIFAHIKSLAQQ